MQNAGPWDSWLPVVENSRLFAQRVCTAHGAPPEPPPPFGVSSAAKKNFGAKETPGPVAQAKCSGFQMSREVSGLRGVGR